MKRHAVKRFAQASGQAKPPDSSVIGGTRFWMSSLKPLNFRYDAFRTFTKPGSQPITLSGRLRGVCVLTKIFILTCLLGGTSGLYGQASATASRTADLKIGGGFTIANGDYSGRYKGGMAFFTYDFTPHLGIEGNFHFIKGGGSSNLYEKTYEIGGRYFRNYADGKLSPYVKVMYGRGVFNFPAYVPNGPHPNLAYNLFAGGAGIDYKVLPYMYVHGDFEYQHWLGFPPSGLTPTLFSIGAAYHFR